MCREPERVPGGMGRTPPPVQRAGLTVSSPGRAIGAFAPATRLRQTALDRESERLGAAIQSRSRA